MSETSNYQVTLSVTLSVLSSTNSISSACSHVHSTAPASRLCNQTLLFFILKMPQHHTSSSSSYSLIYTRMLLITLCLKPKLAQHYMKPNIMDNLLHFTYKTNTLGLDKLMNYQGKILVIRYS